MKKNFLFLALTLISIVIMVSCSKDKSNTLAPSTSQTDEQLVSKIHWFMNSATDFKEGKILKNGEKMYLDSALYYISATLNYKYCFNAEQIGKFKLDTIEVQIPIIAAESKTYVVDALAGYNLAVEKIRIKYKLITGENKKLVGCMVQNKGINTSNDTITFMITAQISTGISPPQLLFGDEDQYWWTRDSQNCYNGTGNDGAPNIIERNVTARFTPGPVPNCRYWFPVIHSYTFIATEYQVDEIKDNFCDYLIFYASGPPLEVLTNEVQCLGIDPINHPGVNEMNFYCDGLYEIVSQYLNSEMEKVQRIYINNEQVTLGINTIAIKHNPTLFYGVRKLDCSYQQQYPIPIE